MDAQVIVEVGYCLRLPGLATNFWFFLSRILDPFTRVPLLFHCYGLRYGSASPSGKTCFAFLDTDCSSSSEAKCNGTGPLSRLHVDAVSSHTVDVIVAVQSNMHSRLEAATRW